jgi:hypothetical protein
VEKTTHAPYKINAPSTKRNRSFIEDDRLNVRYKTFSGRAPGRYSSVGGWIARIRKSN